MKQIKNKVALVTGASSGIGEETVKQLLGDEAVVYAAARRTERMQSLKALGAHVISLEYHRRRFYRCLYQYDHR